MQDHDVREIRQPRPDAVGTPGHPRLNRQSVTDAHAWLERVAAGTPATDRVPLAEAAGRRLAAELSAPSPWPPHAVAAIDGHAVRAAATVGASDYSPLPFRAVDGSAALRPGEACPLAAGDALPEGADAVIDDTLVERHGRALEVSGTVAPGSGVIAAGEEFGLGEVLLSARHRLRPQDLALLALAGLVEVPVWQAPRVRILLAGRFLHDADGPMLRAAVTRDGGRVTAVDTVGTNDALAAALATAGEDLVIVAGGTGEGDDDFAAATLARCGAVDIYGVAMNPGETVALGRVDERPVLLLPGQPLACLYAYDLLASRLVQRLAGGDGVLPYPTTVLPLARKVASTIGRLEVGRVRVRDGLADPLVIAENRLLTTAVQADGFILIPENSEGYPAGTRVTVHLYTPVADPGQGDTA